jgi:Histidine kinase
MASVISRQEGAPEQGSGNSLPAKERGGTWSHSNSGFIVPIVVVLTFLGLINSLQAYLIYFPGENSVPDFLRYLASNLFYSWYYVLPAFAIERLSSRLSLKKDTLLTWLVTHLVTMVLLTLLHQGVSLGFDRLVLEMRRDESIFGVLFNNPAVWGDVVAYVLFLLGFYMIEYRRRDQEYELEYSRLEAELARTRIQELRGRIRPDFLLDSLDSLRSLLHRGMNTEANGALSLLSEFLRSTVYDHDREDATLREEIDSVIRYVDMERLRSGKAFVVAEKISKRAGTAVVPYFILQPIVEELVRSNLDTPRQRCDIELMAEMDGKWLEITIGTGNGSLRGGGGDFSGTKVVDIANERLERMFGSDHECRLVVSPGGTEVLNIRVPFRPKFDGDRARREEPR